MEFLDTLAASPALYIGCCVALGLMVGSFLNVVIYRVPIMMDHELRTECALLAAATGGREGRDPCPSPVCRLLGATIHGRC